MPLVTQRIRQIIDANYNGSVRAFCLSIGLVDSQKVNRLFKPDKRNGKYPTPSIDIVSLISNKLDISLLWLQAGEGSMLKDSKKNAQALSSVDGEVMGVIKISPQNDDTTFKNSDDMEINQLLAAILQHGADLRAQNEELRKQGERLDRILALTSPTPAAVFVPSSQETERNSPPRTQDRRVSEL